MKRIVFFGVCFCVLICSKHVYSQSEKTEKQLITELIEKKRAFNKEYGYGFRLQLYNGYEVEAKKMRAKFQLDFPDIQTFLIYQQPEWKIQVGHYRSRLEADRAVLNLRRKYPSVIVVPLGK